MKANYLPKNRLRHPYFRRIAVLAVVFVFGIFVFSFFDGTIITIVSPAWKAENIIARSLRNSFIYLRSQKMLVAENVVLKEKVSSLETEILSLLSKRVQENILLELVGRRLNSNMVAAAVLTHPPQTPYDIIIIDAGSEDSVTLGSEVSLPEGPILGAVLEVFPKRARVKLLSASGEETNAILERNDVPIVLEGTGGGSFKFILPRDIRVEKGDRILSPSITPSLLAVVAEVSTQSTDSFQEVLAQSPTNIFAIRFVFVTP